MENRNPKSNQRLPGSDSKLRIYPTADGKSGGRQVGRTANESGATRTVTPKIGLQFGEERTVYEPGDVLVCQYHVLFETEPSVADAQGGEESEAQVSAVESSVIWYTDGKGDEDMGVHFFERRKKSVLQPKQLAETHRISTVLPKSPLSYEGEIVQVRWCVRIRVFLTGDRQFTEDLPFQLGQTIPVSSLSQESE